MKYKIPWGKCTFHASVTGQGAIHFQRVAITGDKAVGIGSTLVIDGSVVFGQIITVYGTNIYCGLHDGTVTAIGHFIGGYVIQDDSVCIFIRSRDFRILPIDKTCVCRSITFHEHTRYQNEQAEPMLEVQRQDFPGDGTAVRWCTIGNHQIATCISRTVRIALVGGGLQLIVICQ